MTNTAARRRWAHVPPVNRRPISRLPPVPQAVVPLEKARPCLIVIICGYLAILVIITISPVILLDACCFCSQCARAESLLHRRKSVQPLKKDDRIRLLPSQQPSVTKSASVCCSLPCLPKHAHSSAPALCVHGLPFVTPV